MSTIAQHRAQTMLTKIRVLEQGFGYKSDTDKQDHEALERLRLELNGPLAGEPNEALQKAINRYNTIAGRHNEERTNLDKVRSETSNRLATFCATQAEDDGTRNAEGRSQSAKRGAKPKTTGGCC